MWPSAKTFVTDGSASVNGTGTFYSSSALTHCVLRHRIVGTGKKILSKLELDFSVSLLNKNVFRL